MVAIWLWDRSVCRVRRLNVSKCVLRFVCLAATGGVLRQRTLCWRSGCWSMFPFPRAGRLDVVPVSSSFGCAKACLSKNWLHGAARFIDARQQSLSTGEPSLEAIEVVACPLPFCPAGWNCTGTVSVTSHCGFIQWLNPVSCSANFSRAVCYAYVSMFHCPETLQGKHMAGKASLACT